MAGSGGTHGTSRTGQPDRSARRAAFLDAYDRVLQRSAAPLAAIDLTSEFGTTRVFAGGPAEAPPVLLIHAYQATSAEWLALAGLLSSDRRLYAIDMMGDAGHSVPGERAVRTPDDLVDYLDTVLAGLGLSSAELCGHSFGAWIALSYAISRPARVDRLILLDPTMTFSSLLPTYVLRATPSLLKPSSARRRSLIRWETRKADIDPAWLELTGMAADTFGGLPTVPTRIPKAATVAALTMPALVIVAGRSRVHNKGQVARRAGSRLPHVRVEIVQGASHYGLPLTHAAEIAALIRLP